MRLTELWPSLLLMTSGVHASGEATRRRTMAARSTPIHRAAAREAHRTSLAAAAYWGVPVPRSGPAWAGDVGIGIGVRETGDAVRPHATSGGQHLIEVLLDGGLVRDNARRQCVGVARLLGDGELSLRHPEPAHFATDVRGVGEVRQTVLAHAGGVDAQGLELLGRGVAGDGDTTLDSRRRWRGAEVSYGRRPAATARGGEQRRSGKSEQQRPPLSRALGSTCDLCRLYVVSVSALAAMTSPVPAVTVFGDPFGGGVIDPHEAKAHGIT